MTRLERPRRFSTEKPPGTRRADDGWRLDRRAARRGPVSRPGDATASSRKPTTGTNSSRAWSWAGPLSSASCGSISPTSGHGRPRSSPAWVRPRDPRRRRGALSPGRSASWASLPRAPGTLPRGPPPPVRGGGRPARRSPALGRFPARTSDARDRPRGRRSPWKGGAWPTSGSTATATRRRRSPPATSRACGSGCGACFRDDLRCRRRAAGFAGPRWPGFPGRGARKKPPRPARTRASATSTATAISTSCWRRDGTGRSRTSCCGTTGPGGFDERRALPGSADRTYTAALADPRRRRGPRPGGRQRPARREAALFQ